MPKPYLIGVEIEESSLGSVMRKLDGLQGVTKIHWNMDRDKTARVKPNGHHPDRKPPGRFGVPGQVAIARMLHGKPPMTAPQIADAFAAQGRSPKSISSCLHKMRASGEISSGPEGYSLTKKMRDRMRAKKRKVR